MADQQVLRERDKQIANIMVEDFHPKVPQGCVKLYVWTYIYLYVSKAHNMREFELAKSGRFQPFWAKGFH